MLVAGTARLVTTISTFQSAAAALLEQAAWVAVIARLVIAVISMYQREAAALQVRAVWAVGIARLGELLMSESLKSLG